MNTGTSEYSKDKNEAKILYSFNLIMKIILIFFSLECLRETCPATTMLVWPIFGQIIYWFFIFDFYRKQKELSWFFSFQIIFYNLEK